MLDVMAAAAASTDAGLPNGPGSTAPSPDRVSIWSAGPVSINPKYAIPTPTPSPATSMRTARTKDATPAFDATYALTSGPGITAAIEATTMKYPPRALRCGSAAWIVWKTPTRLTSMTCRQSAASTAATVDPGPAMPALATTTSTAPKCRATAPHAALTVSAEVTSASNAAVAEPSSATSRCADARSRSRTATLAPASTRSRANCAPIPRAPPVITTTFALRLWLTMTTL